jgi:hypothetical protein
MYDTSGSVYDYEDGIRKLDMGEFEEDVDTFFVDDDIVCKNDNEDVYKKMKIRRILHLGTEYPRAAIDLILSLESREKDDIILPYEISNFIKWFYDHKTNKMKTFTWRHIWSKENKYHCDVHIGFTILHVGALYDHGILVQALLEYGIQSRTKDPYGRTALHVCSTMGHYDIAFLLIKHDWKNVLDKTVSCATSLHKAVDNGHLDIVKLLIEYGANIDDRCEILENVPNAEFPIMCEYDVEQLLTKEISDTCLQHANWKGRQCVLDYIQTLKLNI